MLVYSPTERPCYESSLEPRASGAGEALSLHLPVPTIGPLPNTCPTRVQNNTPRLRARRRETAAH
eukprot:11044974-Alexandrium_andersonii.AAC.1